MPARELVRLTKESLDLARALGEPNILDIAESAAGSNCARLKRRQLAFRHAVFRAFTYPAAIC